MRVDALARDAVDRALQRLDAEVAVVMELMRKQAQDAGLLAIRVQALMDDLQKECRAKREIEETRLLARWTAFHTGQPWIEGGMPETPRLAS